MNWYNKPIFKIAGIDDILRGVTNARVQDYPPEGQLSDKQKEVVRSLISSYYSPISLADQLTLFLRYPETLQGRYNIFNLAEYNSKSYQPDKDLMGQAWSLIRDSFIKGAISYLPIGLPNEVYMDILRNGNLTIELVANAFENESWYPPFVIDHFKKEYPDIYRSVNTTSDEEQVELIRHFIQAPSEDSYSVLKSSLLRKVQIAIKDPQFAQTYPLGMPLQIAMYKFSLNLGVIENRIKEDLSHVRLYASYSGDEIDELMTKLQTAAEEHRELHLDENMFSVYGVSDPIIGDVPLFHFGEFRVHTQTVENVRALSASMPDKYLDIILVNNLDDYRDNYVTIKEIVSVNTNPVVLASNDTAWVVGQWFDPKGRFGHSQQSGVAGAALGVTFLSARGEPHAFEEWYFDQKEKAGDKEAFYLELMASPGLHMLTERVDNQMYAIYAQNARLIKEEDYHPGASYSYDEIPEFYMRTALRIWEDIPPAMRLTGGKNAPSRFVMCSGLFPRQVVLERAMRYPSDSIKIVDHIQTLEGNDAPLRQQVRTVASEEKQRSTKEIKLAIPAMIESGTIIVRQISDFPTTYEHAVAAIHRLTDSSPRSSWNDEPAQTLTDMAIERLHECQVFLIRTYEAIDAVGENHFRNAGLDPSNVLGVFCPRFGALSDEKDTIAVFLSRTQSVGEAQLEQIIMNTIGVPTSDAFGRIAEEGTFWHEVAHGIVNFSNPDQEPEEATPNDITSWIKNPQELLAIQYGNLAFIKNRLRALFSNGIPEDGAISAGLMEHLKSEVIKTFAWEFEGMRREEALQYVEDAFENFSSDVQGMSKSMSKEEKVTLLVDIFSEFYLQRLLRTKVEDDISRLLEDMNVHPEEVITTRQEVVVPEKYEYRSPGTRDKFIAEFEKKPYYKKFIENAQIIVDRYIANNGGQIPDTLRRYVHKNDPTKLRVPWNLSDLLLMVYGPPATLSSVDVTQSNYIFSGIVPPELKTELDRIVRQQQTILEQVPMGEQEPVTPEEAGEAGRFISEMDREYGPDWVWLAKTRSGWYKRAGESLVPRRRT